MYDGWKVAEDQLPPIHNSIGKIVRKLWIWIVHSAQKKIAWSLLKYDSIFEKKLKDILQILF